MSKNRDVWAISTEDRLSITNVKSIITCPEGIPLNVVKIETSEPGIYGVGCASFSWRPLTVHSAVDDYAGPFLIGRDPRDIEDIWNSLMFNGSWRNGVVLNNAVSGVDMALWDIKGKLANMPVYQLMGGKCRPGVAVYRHADGRDAQEVEDNVRRHIAQGYHYIRCQLGGYGGGNRKTDMFRPEALPYGKYFDPDAYARSVPALLEHVRKAIGFDIELLHDVHERLAPIEAVRLAKIVEPYRLFFLEDALPPEQGQWFSLIRQQCAVPLAMGEQFTHPTEWDYLIANRLIDFIRCHISAIGGLTPAKKLAAVCEQFGVRTAWQGPGDVSPIGHAANIHLDLSCINFGIQEWCGLTERHNEVFPGCPTVKNGYVYANDNPGLGIDIDEKEAAKYPYENSVVEWTMTRLPDGTAVRP